MFNYTYMFLLSYAIFFIINTLFLLKKQVKNKNGVVLWGLERINRIYINFNGNMHFDIRAFRDARLAAERIKLASRRSTVLGFCNSPLLIL